MNVNSLFPCFDCRCQIIQCRNMEPAEILQFNSFLIFHCWWMGDVRTTTDAFASGKLKVSSSRRNPTAGRCGRPCWSSRGRSQYHFHSAFSFYTQNKTITRAILSRNRCCISLPGAEKNLKQRWHLFRLQWLHYIGEPQWFQGEP